ncbi:hypothetical protein [Frigoriglobus tundricola]|uniref:Lipoprotein n=1 Tax=Frigoriglobus tundricola TaxID=2774151 RepID=A0A6M5YHU0_9BACT|nr:hypothetical protein [Frigoriglobus tundricola]QJW93617.1 hypothetical protein FTUN_1125 [Frigoriglobus tundricola]
MRYLQGLVFALVACGASAGAPAPPDGVPPEAVKAVKGALPKGWTAAASGATLTIRCEKKIGLYNPIGLPAALAAHPPTPTAIEPYEITLRFRPRVTTGAFEELRKENEATAAKLDAMRDELRAAGIVHKFDDWLPDTPEQKKQVADYRAAQKAMPFHRLPDLYTQANSIDIEDSVRSPLAFTDAEEAKECRRVKEAIRGLFKSHSGR